MARIRPAARPPAPQTLRLGKAGAYLALDILKRYGAQRFRNSDDREHAACALAEIEVAVAPDVDDAADGAEAVVNDLTIPEIEAVLADVTDPAELDAIEAAESAGKARVGVFVAIASRRTALQDAPPDE